MIRLAMVAALVAGCGAQEDQDELGAVPLQEVAFAAGCGGLSCDDVTAAVRAQYPGSVSYTCFWYCAPYDGEPDRSVIIRFESTADDPCWSPAFEHVGPGTCDASKPTYDFAVQDR